MATINPRRDWRVELAAKLDADKAQLERSLTAQDARLDQEQEKWMAGRPIRHGAIYNRDPAQVQAIDAEVAANYGQRTDGSGPYSGGLTVGGGDMSLDPRWANLMALQKKQQGEAAAARTQTDADFNGFLSRAPKTMEDSYGKINATREQAGLPAIATPDPNSTSFRDAQSQAVQNKEGVAKQNQAKGQAIQKQNATAAEMMRLQELMPGQDPMRTKMMLDSFERGGAPSPQLGPEKEAILYGPGEAAGLAKGRLAAGTAQQEFAAKQSERTAELQLNALRADYIAAKSTIDQKLATATPAERGALQAQLSALDIGYAKQQADIMRGATGQPPMPAPPAMNAPAAPGANQTVGQPQPVGQPAAQPAVQAQPASLSAIASQPATPQPVVWGNGRTSDGLEISSFPIVRNNDDYAAALPGFKPAFVDFRSASDFAKPQLESTFSKAYRPVGPWNDSGPGGKPDGIPSHDEVLNLEDLRYYLGQARTKQILSELEGYLASAGGDVASQFEGLRNNFAAKYGDDAVRWAMAQKYDRPDWISDINKWNAFTSQPAPKASAYMPSADYQTVF